ncbi:MAG: Trk system potassium transporter TrkA [Oscillospiraceae bacterium]|nr:Trk system potassium transporter TrkA [Oscillospiraceae bacterium]
MNIIVIGGGKVGRTLVEYLKDHNVVLIDKKRSVLEKGHADVDVRGMGGNGSDVDVLAEAGVKRADLVIVVTNSDEFNILCCIIAKKLGAKRCVARVRTPGYYMQFAFMHEELGINLIVNPELSAAGEISRILRFPAAIKTETFAKGRIELAEMRVDERSPLVGKALYEIYSKYKLKVLVCAVQRGDDLIIPNGDFVVQPDDKIHVTATHRDISKFMREVGIDNQRLKSVLLIGGGRISYYLANQLIECGMKVKIIEKDMDRCGELAELLPKASIICADGTDKNTLTEEGIEHIDALVTLTGIDEENIIVSLYAQSLKVDKVITKINRLAFSDMLNSIGIDSIVTPKDTTANIILGYVRAMENSSGTEINALYRIVSNKAEAIEFRVTNEPKLTSIPLKNLKLKKNILIASILHGGRPVIPDGNSTIEPGDSLVIVTTLQLKKITDILA